MSEIIRFKDENNRESIQKLLDKYQISTVIGENLAEHALCLVLENGRLGLLDTSGQIAKTALVIDFVEGALGHRFAQGIGRQQPIAKAFGLHKSSESRHIIDATAGLGRDAFVLAACGCQVDMIEQSNIVCALLEDAMVRAQADVNIASIMAKMTLKNANFVEILGCDQVFGVYLDPMFPVRAKSALVKKEMQLFHSAIHQPENDDAMLAAACRLATHRVVVKRPKTAPPLAGRPPNHEIKTKQMRFDVYLL